MTEQYSYIPIPPTAPTPRQELLTMMENLKNALTAQRPLYESYEDQVYVACIELVQGTIGVFTPLVKP